VTRARRDRGAADALALVLIAPAVIALALLVVWFGRSVEARSSVQAASEAAAQAAALERDPAAARSEAVRVATVMLTDVDTCSSRQVYVDVTDFRPGGRVAVTISCTPTFRGIEGVEGAVDDANPGGDYEVSVTATARIDPFRAAG
jgi:Flp pilus assembly protein TadG